MRNFLVKRHFFYFFFQLKNAKAQCEHKLAELGQVNEDAAHDEYDRLVEKRDELRTRTENLTQL